jgi:hypothetical protein
VVALIAIDTLIVALLAVLMVGLLRSHGEILRRLGTSAQGTSAQGSSAYDATATDPSADGRARMRAGIQDPRSVVTPAFDISGSNLSRDTVNISMTTGADTLIAFLSSGCLTCQTLWRGWARTLGHLFPMTLGLWSSPKIPPSRARRSCGNSPRLGSIW